MISETYGLVGELFLASDATSDHDDFLDEGVELGGHVDVFVLQRDAAALHLHLLHQPDTSNSDVIRRSLQRHSSDFYRSRP